MSTDSQRWLEELERLLESVHALRPADPQVIAARGIALLTHELRRITPHAPSPRSRPALLEQLQHLTADELRAVRLRCLYYATHDLVALLVHRSLRRNAVAREEAIMYVHERLQRDDFRRIDGFDTAHGASFKTYMWQVVSRLIIDFHRSRRPDHEEGAAIVDAIADQEPSPEGNLSDAQLRESIGMLFAESESTLATRNALRDRLREHLDLTSTERLFLKAIFQHELSIDEVRRLPGFEMSSAEAWRYYYRLLERLLDAFKNADALEGLRSLTSTEHSWLEVTLDQGVARIDVTRIRYVKQATLESSSCHADWQGRLARGVIGENFARLKKKLAPWFTPINATTLVADDQLRDMHELWMQDEARPMRIPGVEEAFVIGRTQWPQLRRRYGGKNAGGDSYMDRDIDAAGTAGRAQGS